MRATARPRSTTCFARPAQTCRPCFVAMTYVVMPCYIYVCDLGEAPFFVFWTWRITCDSRQLGRGLEAWATTAGNTNGDVEAWYMAPLILLGIYLHGCKLNAPFHNNCCAVFQSSVDRQSTIQRSIERKGFPQKSSFLYAELCFVAVRCCLLGACRLS